MTGGDKAAEVKMAPAVLSAPQVDYTKSGTCNLCHRKRENVSLAHEECFCTVTFDLEEAFKVSLSRQRAEEGAERLDVAAEALSRFISQFSANFCCSYRKLVKD